MALSTSNTTSSISSSPSSSSLFFRSSTSTSFSISFSSSTSSIFSGTHDSSHSSFLSFSSESMVVHTSECDTRPLESIAPLRKETAEKEILDGITQLAVMVDRRDNFNSNLREERDKLALGIEDAKVLLGLHLCRIEDDLTREVLLETFLLHLGPTDAPWMLAPLMARIASGV